MRPPRRSAGSTGATNSGSGNARRQFDSPVGVYGGFYAIRRELAVRQPAGMILDDMFQPLSIIRQGYRSVLDPHALCLRHMAARRLRASFIAKCGHWRGTSSSFSSRPGR